MLNPIHLRTLRECVSTGSFAEAARNLGYTSSAVSQQMFLLERAIGAPLFERSARSVRATAVAELLAARSAAVLGALTTLEREASALAGQAGRRRGLPTAHHPAQQRLRGDPRPGGPRPHRYVLALHRPNNTNPLLPLALDCLAEACAEFAGAREW